MTGPVEMTLFRCEMTLFRLLFQKKKHRNDISPDKYNLLRTEIFTVGSLYLGHLCIWNIYVYSSMLKLQKIF